MVFFIYDFHNDKLDDPEYRKTVNWKQARKVNVFMDFARVVYYIIIYC